MGNSQYPIFGYWVLLNADENVKFIMMIPMTMILKVRQRREGNCWSRTSRVNVSSSALPGLLEGDLHILQLFLGAQLNTSVLQDGRIWRQSSPFPQSAMTM